MNKERRDFIRAGDKFSKWTAISSEFMRRSPDGTSFKYVTVRCKCGHVKNMRPATLIHKKSNQCIKCARNDRRKKHTTSSESRRVVSNTSTEPRVHPVLQIIKVVSDA